MNYIATSAAKAVEALRTLIVHCRDLRSNKEFWTLIHAERGAFLSQFEKRKPSTKTRARAFLTPRIHEHARIRCASLRPDQTQRLRLGGNRDKPIDRIGEATGEACRSEIEGLRVSLTGVNGSLAPIDQRAGSTFDISVRAFTRVTARPGTAGPQRAVGVPNE